jgi:subtilisin family serine protease
MTTNIPGRINYESQKLFDKDELKFPENERYNYTASFNGTSAAAPTASGVIALMLEANPKLTFWEVKYILAKTARRNILVENPKPFCVKVLEK